MKYLITLLLSTLLISCQERTYYLNSKVELAETFDVSTRRPHKQSRKYYKTTYPSQCDILVMSVGKEKFDTTYYRRYIDYNYCKTLNIYDTLDYIKFNYNKISNKIRIKKDEYDYYNND